MAQSDAKLKIKQAAQSLFAERGIDGVTVREIVKAADQRNMASLHYYFSNKENLIKELVVDAARLMDGRRNVAIDKAEQTGGPTELREVVRVIVDSMLVEPDEDPRNISYMRFVTKLLSGYRWLFEEAIGAEWNTGYQRCLAHLRRLAPAEIPVEIINQRLLYMSIAVMNVAAAREESIATADRNHPYWNAPQWRENLIDSLVGLIIVPPSAETLSPGSAAAE